MRIPSNRSLLIVDDEPAIRDALARFLETHGYEPRVASDGPEALDMVSRHEFDIVLLDIRMPGLSGMEVLERIKTEHPDTAVMMITAVADVATAVEAMKLGAYDYVTKPFNLDDMLVRVEKALK